ncbi:MAG TPA: DUF4426 domain-containing protein [Pseudomonadales bacterium]
MLQNRVLSFFLMLMLSAAAVHADTSVQRFGDHEVHYSVFNTSFLTPQVASAYDIVRSGRKALMNIAVLKRQNDGSLVNVAARVSGDQFDLIRREPLTFREVREQHAIYYLASFDIQHMITIYFTVNVEVEGQQPFKVQFNKMLYNDE